MLQKLNCMRVHQPDRSQGNKLSDQELGQRCPRQPAEEPSRCTAGSFLPPWAALSRTEPSISGQRTISTCGGATGSNPLKEKDPSEETQPPPLSLLPGPGGLPAGSGVAPHGSPNPLSEAPRSAAHWQRWRRRSAWRPPSAMADEELEALRRQRLAELQAKHGVRRGRGTPLPAAVGSDPPQPSPRRGRAWCSPEWRLQAQAGSGGSGLAVPALRPRGAGGGPLVLLQREQEVPEGRCLPRQAPHAVFARLCPRYPSFQWHLFWECLRFPVLLSRFEVSPVKFEV